MSVDTAALERTIVFDKLDEIYALCRQYNVQRLDLFGSALRDDFVPDRSDINYLVVYRPHTPEEHYENFFGLWEALKAQFAREIGLIEASTVKNPYIGQAIHASRVMVYSAPVDHPPSS